MPVFNTGSYLAEAIASVLGQIAIGNCELPKYELIIVDDRSDDPLTLSILGTAKKAKNVRVITNERKKGAAGARNTGILHSNSKWIGFLDSDDLWLPDALFVRWRFIEENQNIKWVASHFFLDKPGLGIIKNPLSDRSPTLYATIKDDYDAGRPSCLIRPVEILARNCLLQPGTVLIERQILISQGMFNENLRRAEDYHLWFKCALDTDLWILPFDLLIYRLRPGSLSRGKEPIFACEDQMIDLLLADTRYDQYKQVLLRRLDFVYDDYCYFYRNSKMYIQGVRWALTWILRRPFNPKAWKQMIATLLKI